MAQALNSLRRPFIPHSKVYIAPGGELKTLNLFICQVQWFFILIEIMNWNLVQLSIIHLLIMRNVHSFLMYKKKGSYKREHNHAIGKEYT